jgi:hypothetical protein
MAFEPSSGRLIEVEFWEDGQWDMTNILWPEDDRVKKPEVAQGDE